MNWLSKTWMVSAFYFLNHFRHPFFHHFRRRNLSNLPRTRTWSYNYNSSRWEGGKSRMMIDLMESALLFQFQIDVSWLLSNGYVVITYRWYYAGCQTLRASFSIRCISVSRTQGRENRLFRIKTSLVLIALNRRERISRWHIERTFAIMKKPIKREYSKKTWIPLMSYTKNRLNWIQLRALEISYLYDSNIGYESSRCIIG